jgi:acetyl-CoA carboxylase alpha subunit
VILELHGDRGFKDDKAMIGGLGKIRSSLLLVNKRSITQRLRNFGMANQKDIESFAFDENGREIRHTCSDS